MPDSPTMFLLGNFGRRKGEVRTPSPYTNPT